MTEIKHTYTLDLVSEKPVDAIMDNPDLLKRVAEFYNSHSDTLILIANVLNEVDARYLIQHALGEEVTICRAKMVGRESFVEEIMKYSAEQKRREEEAKEIAENTEEEVTLESPPEVEA